MRSGPRRTAHPVPSRTEDDCGCWLVALPAVDGRQYVYRVYAPADALLADLFWEAWHCHDENRHPRASDRFDAAVIRRIGLLEPGDPPPRQAR